MKKICILQNSMTFGGTDTFVINLCKGLIQDGYDVTVILSVDEQEELPREHELLSTGIRVVKTCHLRGFKSKLRHLRLLYKELKKESYSVFQTNIDLFNGPQMFVAWLAGVPIRECHSHNSEQGREMIDGRSLPIIVYQKIMRWLCWTFSNRRGGCSELALDFLCEGNWKKDSKAKVIHNGIDFQEYQKEFIVEEKKAELGLHNKFNISTVGRISFQKNPEFLLDVFNEICKEREDIDLVWCGKGEEEEHICLKTQEYGLESRVHLLGARSDIPEILRCTDLFFLPSRFEGLGIVLVEAQAANLPCVMSDVIPKAVDCGLCLSLSLDLEKKMWAKEMTKILDKGTDMHLDIGKLNEYSIEHMVKEMEDLFE